MVVAEPPWRGSREPRAANLTSMSIPATRAMPIQSGRVSVAAQGATLSPGLYSKITEPTLVYLGSAPRWSPGNGELRPNFRSFVLNIVDYQWLKDHFWF